MGGGTQKERHDFRRVFLFGTPEAVGRKMCLWHVFPLRVPSQEGECRARSLIGIRCNR